MSEPTNPYQASTNASAQDDSSQLFPNLLHSIIGGMIGLGTWGLYAALEPLKLTSVSIPFLWFILVGIVAGLGRMNTVGILAIILAYTSLPLFMKSKFFPLTAIIAFFTASTLFVGWLPIFLMRRKQK